MATNIIPFGNNIVVSVYGNTAPIIISQPAGAGYGNVRYLGAGCVETSINQNVFFKTDNASYFKENNGATLCTLPETDIYFKYTNEAAP